MKKSLLIDMNNLIIRCLYSAPVMSEKEFENKIPIWKYIVFESILGTIRKFKPKEIILAVDSTNIWRKEYYPIYKENRTEKREEDDFDWSRFFEEYSNYIEELTQLPFRILKIPHCEADDIIAILSFYKKDTDNIIISMDRDYKQLLFQDNCSLYNPIEKKFILLEEDVESFLLHEIIGGQGKDNVFNIITPLNWPGDKRKPPMGDKKIQKILTEGVDEWIENNKKEMKNKYGADVEERFKQNRKILDLREIPIEFKSNILGKYKDYNLPEPDSFYSFFKEKNWPTVLENYNYIENLLLGVY